MVRNVCVYLSSATGGPSHVAAIEALADELARRDLVVVYGGASRGLMGVLADRALAAGAEVVGVIPRALVDLEIAHTGLTELNIVETMHQRKAMMFSLADAFVVASLTQFSLTARLAFLVVGPMIDLKLFAMQAGTLGRGFAMRFAPATFALAILGSVLVGTVLL